MSRARHIRFVLGVAALAAIAAFVWQRPSVVLAGGKPAEAPQRAVCVLRGTAGHEGVHGIVTFTRQGDRVRVVAHVKGLTPGRHGFHIHTYGDLSAPDGTSAGGHFNPEGVRHGLPGQRPRHVGDMGNLEADAHGVATLDRLDDRIRLSGPHGVIGRAIVVHAKPDDGGQPTGHAGARVAVGVIGIARPE